MVFFEVPKLYAIPREDDFILFSPLTGRLSLVDETFFQSLKYHIREGFKEITPEEQDTLVKAGVITDFEIKLPNETMEDFSPTKLTLFPTTRCDLRCIYCYASAGDVEEVDLPIETAFASIDFIVQNAIKATTNLIEVVYHGVGEPTVRWDFLVNTVNYANRLAEKNGLETKTSMSTNGVLTDRRINWIIKNMSNITLSWDGPPEIQNKNRPFKNLEPSSSYLEHTARRFVEAEYPFAVRATITDESIKMLDEIFDYFVDFGVKSISLEPLFSCGRCYTNNLNSPNLDEFADAYMILEDKARSQKIRLRNSFAGFDRITTVFCGGAGSNFCVTPDEYVSSCFEVGLKSDPRSNMFFYGKFNKETGQFDINRNKLQYLQDRNITNMLGCNDCFVQYSCGGECLAKAATFGNIYDVSPEINERCALQKKVGEMKLRKLIRG